MEKKKVCARHCCHMHWFMPNASADAPHPPPCSTGHVVYGAAADCNFFIGQRVGEALHPGIGRPSSPPSGGGGLSESEGFRDCADSESPVLGMTPPSPDALTDSDREDTACAPTVLDSSAPLPSMPHDGPCHQAAVPARNCWFFVPLLLRAAGMLSADDARRSPRVNLLLLCMQYHAIALTEEDTGQNVDTVCSELAALHGQTVSLQQAVATTAGPAGYLLAVAQSAFLQAFGGQALAVEAAGTLAARRCANRP